ncbi:transposase [Bifidobacterium lemurum]|uniref:Transposase n=2 Tax=Bifidobacterium lemurum TaxID=1603886 RepID=A0A261FQF0_9BIFI|nr:transposase [Bifidobacterium lemurum]
MSAGIMTVMTTTKDGASRERTDDAAGSAAVRPDVAGRLKAARDAQRDAAVEFVRMAREQGWDLTGPDGLSRQFTKTVLETALDEEMNEHLGRARHERSRDGRSANARNGTTRKTVATASVGPVEIEVPRDRDGSFDPVIVRKRQRHLSDVDEVVLSLYAKGLTTGEISARSERIYGANVSKETVSRITDRVVDEMVEWSTRPLDPVYAAVFIDATMVKVRDGQVANRAFYVAVGVDLDGNRDVLGIWGSPSAEGARYWLSVLTELKNRGVRDVFFLICDGLKGLPEAVQVVWPLAIARTCVAHLLRNTFNYASKKDWDALRRDLKPVYTAVNERDAVRARDEMLGRWADKYPAIRGLWMNAWDRFVPFLDYGAEIRRIICTTNAIESPDARFKRSIRARGHFPNEQAALKCMYLTVRPLDPTGRGQVRWTTRWKPALNAFAVTFADRWPANTTE